MALGGGSFTSQNKVLPGAYINFVNLTRANIFADRGYCALPIELNWCAENTIMTVTAEEFYTNSFVLFGYDYNHAAMKPLRELFLHAKTAYIYRLNASGVKASNAFATAKYEGTRGNDITIKIENSSIEDNFDVYTYVDGNKVDMQTVLTSASLVTNDFVIFKTDSTLALTAGTPLTSGANGTYTSAQYQSFLNAIEPYYFNIIGCITTDSGIKSLFSNFTKRMRDEHGVKFQCVLHKYETADHEGIISVENNTNPDLIPWVVGLECSVEINQSCTNKIYDGEYTVDTAYTQAQLVAGILAGKLMFHSVGTNVRVLKDINTLLTLSDTKGELFKSNQTIRVIDQIGNDIAKIFNEQYLGIVQNDDIGRLSLWSSIVTHHKALETLRAITDFDPKAITVAQGATKESVIVTDTITVVNAMEKLYMTVVVE